MADATINIEGPKKRLSEIRRFLESDPLLLNQMGVFVTERIVARTLSGEDSKGRNFKPYSDYYSIFRAKRGHPTQPVSLFFSGKMQAKFTIISVLAQ